MALTASNILEKDTIAPDFSLIDTISDEVKTLGSVKGKNATVVMFICNHCPYVVHVNDAVVQLAKDYQQRGVGFVAISSNDVTNYPQDGPDKMKQHAAENGYPFPYLYDETQVVAKAYRAACTPDFYVFDKELKLAYHGQLDAARPGNGLPVSGKDIRAAIDALLKGEEYTGIQLPSIGCNIKWK